MKIKERSESPREGRIALYKSDQQQQSMQWYLPHRQLHCDFRELQ